MVKSSLHILFSTMLKMHPPNTINMRKITSSNAATIFTTYRGASTERIRYDTGVLI